MLPLKSETPPTAQTSILTDLFIVMFSVRLVTTREERIETEQKQHVENQQYNSTYDEHHNHLQYHTHHCTTSSCCSSSRSISSRSTQPSTLREMVK